MKRFGIAFTQQTANIEYKLTAISETKKYKGDKKLSKVILLDRTGLKLRISMEM